MPELDPPRFRPALATDAAAIAELHADSWRRHYRGAYGDSYLDGDVGADRAAVWHGRFRSCRAAQAFYRSMGSTCVERDDVPAPGGVPGRLTGTPACLRLVWRDPRHLLRT